MDVVDLPMEEKLFQMRSAIFNSFPEDIKWEGIYTHIWNEMFPGKTFIEDEEHDQFMAAVLDKYGTAGVAWVEKADEEERAELRKEAEEDDDLWNQ